MRSLLTMLAVLLAGNAGAQQAFEFWPDANYDPAIPTIESVVGHAPGERVTWHRDVVRYFEALERARPEQVAVHRYANTWEGRELIYVVITSPDNMARIDAIKGDMQALRNADKTLTGEAARIIESGPAVTWLAYSIHGDEISGSDASMLTAYHLLAARGDDRVGDILSNSVVILDPMQNPDGRDRFIHSFEIAEGLEPSSSRISAEHDQPWPRGRHNHYLFDLNRDFLAMTQPETVGRVAANQEWYPVVLADLHEMGGDSTYFFPPGSQPINPHLTSAQMQNQELYGKNNARWFDEFGIDYYTRQDYDEFYPGYTSWTYFFGSTAMTYEQASVRGLYYRQYDGNEVSYAESVRNHFVASLATAETTATNRQLLLQRFYDYQVSAIDEGRGDDLRSFIIPTQADQAGANDLAGKLVLQGANVGVATESFSACGEDYAAGSYVIDLSQPAKRLLRTMLDRDIPVDNKFVAEQERRRSLGLRSQFYDVTAWSVPLMMNLTVDACDRVPSVDVTAAGPERVLPPKLPDADATVAYLVPWGERTAIRFLSRALRQGLAVKSTDKAFTLKGTRYPGGTLIVDVADKADDIHQHVREIALAAGASIVAVDDSWVTAGPSFGSREVVKHNAPDVALAWDDPTYPPSAGQSRFVIERQLDYPVTAIRTSRIASADLSDFEVLILPESYGDYAAKLGESGAENLRAWVEQGGVLISLGRATRYLADPDVDLLSIRREDATKDDTEETADAGDEEDEEATVAGRNIESLDQYEQAIEPDSAPPDSLSGVLLRAAVSPDHWLGAGVASSINVLAWGGDIYTPIKRDSGVNVARFSGPDDLLASGFMWEENRKQLAYKPFTVVQPTGRGFVVAFTQDPTVRAYLDGLNVIFANSIFRGAAHARPLH